MPAQIGLKYNSRDRDPSNIAHFKEVLIMAQLIPTGKDLLDAYIGTYTYTDGYARYYFRVNNTDRFYNKLVGKASYGNEHPFAYYLQNITSYPSEAAYWTQITNDMQKSFNANPIP